jgi:hypothetical protein
MFFLRDAGVEMEGKEMWKKRFELKSAMLGEHSFGNRWIPSHWKERPTDQQSVV